MAPSKILSLPPELHCEILSHLNRSHHVAAALVCPLWHCIISSAPFQNKRLPYSTNPPRPRKWLAANSILFSARLKMKMTFGCTEDSKELQPRFFWRYGDCGDKRYFEITNSGLLDEPALIKPPNPTLDKPERFYIYGKIITLKTHDGTEVSRPSRFQTKLFDLEDITTVKRLAQRTAEDVVPRIPAAAALGCMGDMEFVIQIAEVRGESNAPNFPRPCVDSF
ncbi:hypothetical protein TWF481_006378 [Arthrobotrys musiformis]|uniref:F-box domain-containing protein n=1 Tax=Arthrobotrys musiformis TaxID=47236 RepID=A0AAV9WM75_9PEZI